MNLLIICAYPHGTAPSQRFRIEQYIPHLEKAGIKCHQRGFLNANTYSKIYGSGNFAGKVLGVMVSFFKRAFLMTQLRKYDLVYVLREASPVGWPIFEWWIAKVARKTLVYDFDDAIWLNSSKTGKLKKWIKNRGKVKRICRWSDSVIVGNEYLLDFAIKHNPRSQIIPTVVNTEHFKNKVKGKVKSKGESLIIGWTGSHSTLTYLQDILPELLETLEANPEFHLQIVCNKDPNILHPRVKFIKWTASKEVEDLQAMDIGLMPLPDNEWTKGKCAFKAIQYMSVGIPCLLSPVGANLALVEDGLNGVFCFEKGDWKREIENLPKQEERMREMGAKARLRIESSYSLDSTVSTFIQFLRDSVS